MQGWNITKAGDNRFVVTYRNIYMGTTNTQNGAIEWIDGIMRDMQELQNK
jgi:hypothetical protein